MGINGLTVSGSIGAVAKRDGQSLAESFLSADAIILVDVSGSMGTNDSRGGQTRYDVACQELVRLQEQMPGKLAVVAFSDVAQFCPSGIPPFWGSGTNLAGALEFVQPADGTVRFIVVSDGYPDEAQAALSIAAGFQSQIDCVYVGPERDRSGAEFLQRLARAGRGHYVVDTQVDQLAEKVETLLLAGS